MQHDDVLRQSIGASLRQFELHALPDTDAPRGRAAVALVVSEQGFGAQFGGLPVYPHWNTQAALVLTRRALQLRNHANQWALPGGRIEAGETAEQAALRELFEEVRLRLQPDAILGRLDDYATRSGFIITPVVVWSDAARNMTPNADEVASIHRIGMDEFLRPEAPLLDHLPGQVHPVLRMPIGDSWIAAPTAAVLYQFREVCLLARPTRVAHFGQPEFAWR